MTTFCKSRVVFAGGICLLLVVWLGGVEARAEKRQPGAKTTGIPSTSTSQEWRDLKAAYQASLESGVSGRFQAVRLDGSSIFVLDSRLGHMWVWAFGKEGGFTMYQGRVAPGLKMGDVVDTSEGVLDQRKK